MTLLPPPPELQLPITLLSPQFLILYMNDCSDSKRGLERRRQRNLQEIIGVNNQPVDLTKKLKNFKRLQSLTEGTRDDKKDGVKQLQQENEHSGVVVFEDKSENSSLLVTINEKEDTPIPSNKKEPASST
jgi:hypothetical protein